MELSEIRSVSEIDADRSEAALIVIAADTVTGAYLLLNIIASFRQTGPEYDVELHVGRSEDVIRELLNQEAHLGISTQIDGFLQSRFLDLAPWRILRLALDATPNYDITTTSHLQIYAVGRMSDQLAERLSAISEAGAPTPHVVFLASA